MKHDQRALILLPALLLALLCASGTAARAIYASEMEDVSESDYYYDAVSWALANDITTGTTATAFSPRSVCTRAQVMTFLHRAAGQPEAQSETNPFYDVAASDYFYKAVLWAVEQGIANGVSPHMFAPDEPCTVEQILTFLWRAKGSPAGNGEIPASVHGWAADAVAWARDSGLPRDGEAFSDACTRGSAVYYLYLGTVRFSDGVAPFEGYVPVELNGGVYAAPTTSAFVSAAMTLADEYADRVSADGADAAYASGRLIVSAARPLPDLTAYHAAQVVAGANGDYLVQFTSAADAEACAAYLSALDFVAGAEPDVLLEASAEGSGGSLSWGADATGTAAYAADLVSRGVDTNVVVAVVDTGVDLSHPFLQGRLVPGYDFVGRDAVADDKAGHGTHVAGTIVDCTPGTNVRIMPVCVLTSYGGYSSIIAQGIRYAADRGARVINLSLGGRHSDYVDRAVAYALARGVTVVAAAGNENRNAAYSCPAHIPQVITVAAVDGSLRRAGFSNYGSAVDIAAPGVGVNSSVPGGGYASMQGTSMAAPHVSAASALLLCEQRGLLPGTVERRLKAAARDLGSASYYGAGFLDMTPLTSLRLPADTAAGGVCGPNVSWSLDGDTLTILGTGPMYDYADAAQVPWAAQRETIRVLRMDVRVTSIGAYAFAGCTGLPALTVMDSLSGIGAHAFDGSGISSLSIRGMVGSIGEGAFANCASLRAVLISGIVGRIGANAFAGCGSLQDVFITGIVQYIDPRAFPTLR